MTEPIKVEGLDTFLRQLRKLDSDLPKGMRIALNAAACGGTLLPVGSAGMAAPLATIQAS